MARTEVPETKPGCWPARSGGAPGRREDAPEPEPPSHSFRDAQVGLKPARKTMLRPTPAPASQVPGCAELCAPPLIFRTHQGVSRSVLARRHLARLHVFPPLVIRGEKAAWELLAQAPPAGGAEGGVTATPCRTPPPSSSPSPRRRMGSLLARKVRAKLP